MIFDIVIAEKCLMLSLEVELPSLLGTGVTGIQIEKPRVSKKFNRAITFLMHLKIMLILSTVPIKEEKQIKILD